MRPPGVRTGDRLLPQPGGFATLEGKYDAADLVVVASSSTRDGTAPVVGVDAHAHEVRVDEVLKGGTLTK